MSDRFIDNENSKYVWVAADPLKNTVVLCQDTFEHHITGGGKTQEDVQLRSNIAYEAKEVIENPRFILKDKDYNVNRREVYIDVRNIPERQGLTILSVVVETTIEPREVVTFIPQRKLGREGEVIYDANCNK